MLMQNISHFRTYQDPPSEKRNRGKKPNDLDFWTHLHSKFGRWTPEDLDFEGASAGLIFWTLDLDFGIGLLDFSAFGLQVQGHELGSSGFLSFGLLLGAPVPILLELDPKSEFPVQNPN